jgi:hypothetical protein
MIRYHYFIKATMERATMINRFHCIRVPDGDLRIPTLLKEYSPVGWNVLVQYQFPPSEQEETFQLRTYFKTFQWNDEFFIEAADSAKDDKLA